MAEKDNKLNFIRQLVESGDLSSARLHLRELKTTRLPHPQRLPLALWARRAGVPELALKILNPLVHPDRGDGKAAPAEIAEYGASLIKVGAVDEALGLLQNLNPNEVPESLLFRAYGLISRWNYAGSIPLLERYIQQPLDPYPFLIGRLNLASAYINQNHVATGPLLESLLRETEERKLLQLKGNTLELLGQWGLKNQDVSFARSHLMQARQTLEDASGMDNLFVDKWLAVCELTESKDAGPIQSILARANRLAHWETVRDCEYHLATLLQRYPLALALYFGTPYESYRQRIEQALPQLEIPDRFCRTARLQYDVIHGEFSQGSSLRPESLKYRLMAALSRDAYRPARVASLAREVYPDEFFNPFSTPTRIHVAINRLRAWMTETGIGPRVLFDGEGYRLPKLGFAVYRNPTVGDIQILANRFGQELFSAKQAAEALHRSHRSANRSLKDALTAGEVEIEGKGTKTRYRVKHSRQIGKAPSKKLRQA